MNQFEAVRAEAQRAGERLRAMVEARRIKRDEYQPDSPEHIWHAGHVDALIEVGPVVAAVADAAERASETAISDFGFALSALHIAVARERAAWLGEHAARGRFGQDGLEAAHARYHTDEARREVERLFDLLQRGEFARAAGLGDEAGDGQPAA